MPDTSQFATYARLLRLTPVEEPNLTTISPPAASAIEEVDQRRRAPRGLVSLLVLLVLPTLIAVTYFWFFAADRYQSEARFVLRMPGRALMNAATANLLQSTGVSRSNDDGYIVREYLESRDAMQWLERKTQLKPAYAVPKSDFIWRFPNALMPNNEEGLFRQYQRMVSASFDNTTGVNSLKVQAFTSADAAQQAGALLDAAEALVNRLNERARRDAIHVAEAEADRMRQRALGSQAALTAFREREQLIDPSQVTLAVLQTIAQLSHEIAQASVQLGELEKSSPKAPQISSLRNRRAALEAQIQFERQRLAGDAKSIAPRIAEYERLSLEREFAEKALMAAMTSVELARVEALKQQVYLERVAAPGRPDYPMYPWRVIWCLTTAAVGYMAWRVWRILAGDTLRHAEE